MDSFSEQLIPKTEAPSDGTKRIIIIAAGVLITFLLLYATFFITPFACIAIAGVVFGVYRLITNTFVEYEYIISNEFMDIDKIINKRRRANLISLDIREITDFGDYEDSTFDGTTVLAAGGDEPLKYAEFKSDRYGSTRLVFSPNEKTLKNIDLFLDRKIKRNHSS